MTACEGEEPISAFRMEISSSCYQQQKPDLKLKTTRDSCLFSRSWRWRTAILGRYIFHCVFVAHTLPREGSSRASQHGIWRTRNFEWLIWSVLATFLLLLPRPLPFVANNIVSFEDFGVFRAICALLALGPASCAPEVVVPVGRDERRRRRWV